MKIKMSVFILVLQILFLFGVYGQSEPPTKPERIFVAYVGALEVLEELVDVKRIVACPTLALNSQYSNCIDFAKKISVTFASPDIELVKKCNPDLVILASFNDPKLLDRLKAFGYRYEIIDRFDSYADICATIQRLGVLVQEEEKASTLIAKMDQQLKEITEDKLAQKYRAMTFGFNYYTGGGGTLFGEMLHLAGAENVSASYGFKGHKQIDLETLIKMNPDYFVIYGEEEKAYTEFLNQMKKTSAFKLIPALQKGSVIVLPMAYGTAASQHFVKGVAILHQKLKSLKP